MKLGAHVSTAGGLYKAIDRGVEMGCETIQIFGSSPQSWTFKSLLPEDVQEFRRRALATGIDPVVFHAIYLVNLGTPNTENLNKGLKSLKSYMNLAAQVGAAGVIFHPGSHKGVGYEGIFEQTVSSIKNVLEYSPPGPWLALENTAGMGHHIGASFHELGQIIEAVDNSRLKVCLDTQHSFAAGYNFSSKDGLEEAMKEFDREVGESNLVAVHANDSKQPLGSGVDRHENIGQGEIGLSGFETIMGHSTFREVPFYLEVPGVERKGPDKENLDVLKTIRKRLDIVP